MKAKNLKLKAQSHSVKLKSGYTAAWVQGLTGIVVWVVFGLKEQAIVKMVR